MRPIDADALKASIKIEWDMLQGGSKHEQSVRGGIRKALRCMEKTPTLVYAPVQKIDGNTSDGYHTFNELYHHRALLFSVVVSQFKDIAWKSKLHYDGTMFDGMFIVGVNTLHGQATYHYDIEPYWDMFDCKEVERAPEWDGHTAEQAIERIATLRLLEPFKTPVMHGFWMLQDDTYTRYMCSVCKTPNNEGWESYCPVCGARMDARMDGEKNDG